MFLQCCSPTAANMALIASIQGAYVQPTGVVLFIMQVGGGVAVAGVELWVSQ